MGLKRKVFGIVTVVVTFIGILSQVPILTVNAEEDLGSIEEIITLYEEEHGLDKGFDDKESEELIEKSREALKGKSYKDTKNLYKWLQGQDDLSLEGQVLKSEVEHSIATYQIIYGMAGILITFIVLIVLIKIVDGF